jgi:hypothetical protein
MMMRRWIIGMSVGLLALSVGASSADERAWLLWRRVERSTMARETPRPTWNVIRAFPSFVTCDLALEDTLGQAERIPRWSQDYHITGTRQDERMIYQYKRRGKASQARDSVFIIIESYVCLPDTIDPRTER